MALDIVDFLLIAIVTKFWNDIVDKIYNNVLKRQFIKLKQKFEELMI